MLGAFRVSCSVPPPAVLGERGAESSRRAAEFAAPFWTAPWRVVQAAAEEALNLANHIR